MSRSYYNPDKSKYSFDYEKQVWIVDGRYKRCGHRPEMQCNCYGRIHEGERAVITSHCH